MTQRPWLIFLLLSFAMSAVVYRSALWGGGMLAPLDLGPTLFKHFDHVDPNAGKIPANHHIIDQFTYDLPLQAAIYRAYREGEIPWWDPWTYGGRPLLADAHVNGTDPIRLLCYATLPFELAYNWNIILRGILTGLGMFLLLRFLTVGIGPAILLSLTYQFGGWFTLFFGHPWIQGSFVYYPFLWMVWIAGARNRFGVHDAIAALLCAFVYYAGNLQSHTYLPIFALTFLTGVFWKERPHFWRAFSIVAFGGIVGALLATPVLANQVEFFLVGLRGANPDASPFARLLALPLSFLAIHPWALGTFRTLDVGKLFGIGGTAFLLFCGGAAFLLALAGVPRGLKKKGIEGAAAATAALCILVFLVVVASPLAKIIYPRIAGMAGMAAIVLAGLASRETVVHALIPQLWAKRLALFHISWILIASVLVIGAFPKFEGRIIAKIEQIGARNSGGLGHMEQRVAQVKRLPNETTLLNPEAVAGMLASVLVLMVLGNACPSIPRDRLLLLSLGCGLVATISFHQRFRPLHDRALWTNLSSGGASQKLGISLAAGGLRLDETMLPLDEQVFPHAWSAYHRVHVVQGYSALQPRCLLWYPAEQPVLPSDWRADYVGDGDGGFVKTSGTSPARFRNSAKGDGAAVRVLQESHNRVLLESNASEIIRTDTRFPGWILEATASPPLDEAYAFSRWKFPAPSEEKTVLRYVPSTQGSWPFSVGVGLIALVSCMFLGRKSKSAGNA